MCGGSWCHIALYRSHRAQGKDPYTVTIILTMMIIVMNGDDPVDVTSVQEKEKKNAMPLSVITGAYPHAGWLS